MKKVTVFESKDGKTFVTESKCKEHEKELLFRDWYMENRLFVACDDSCVDLGDMLVWLQDHRFQVLELLNGE